MLPLRRGRSRGWSATAPATLRAPGRSCAARRSPRTWCRTCCCGSPPSRRRCRRSRRPPMRGGWCAISPSTARGAGASSAATSPISTGRRGAPPTGRRPRLRSRRGTPSSGWRRRSPTCPSPSARCSGCTGSRACRRRRWPPGWACHAPSCAGWCGADTCTASPPSTDRASAPASGPARRPSPRSQARRRAAPSASAANSATIRLASTPS